MPRLAKKVSKIPIPPKAPTSPAEIRPRPTKAEVQAERFPGLDKNPALRRALTIHRAMLAGKSREEAEKLADDKYGPRSPKAQAPKKARGARGKRPEPEKRVRVKATSSRSTKRVR